MPLKPSDLPPDVLAALIRQTEQTQGKDSPDVVALRAELAAQVERMAPKGSRPKVRVRAMPPNLPPAEPGKPSVLQMPATKRKRRASRPSTYIRPIRQPPPPKPPFEWNGGVILLIVMVILFILSSGRW